jgi:hypothetical protein
MLRTTAIEPQGAFSRKAKYSRTTRPILEHMREEKSISKTLQPEAQEQNESGIQMNGAHSILNIYFYGWCFFATFKALDVKTCSGLHAIGCHDHESIAWLHATSRSMPPDRKVS